MPYITANSQKRSTFNTEGAAIADDDHEFWIDLDVHYGPDIPLRVWGTREQLIEQPKAVAEAVAITRHPLAQCFVALMPDFHGGYGMPIGGVFAAEGGVIPNAVGNDIGCGMMAFETDIEADSIGMLKLAEIRKTIHETVPVGSGRAGFGLQSLPQDAFIYTDTEGEVHAAASSRYRYPVVHDAWESSRLQLGTLGGGNHFIEFDRAENGKLWIMLHSGSRGVGAKILKFHHSVALARNKQWCSELPTDQLAFLPEGTEEFECYIREMRWAMRWATENRRAMMSAIQLALEANGIRVPMGEDAEMIETHHNYAAKEHHFGRDYLIHRKGAVRAVGKVIIPGSMGTASYICEGLNNPQAFNSCSHGAGRLRSRAETSKLYTLERAQEEMAGIVFGVREGEFDEMPGAYKNIHAVIDQESDLVKPLHILKPLMVVKG